MKMKTKPLFMFLLVFALFIAMPADKGWTGDDQLIKSCEKCIDKVINKCRCKAALLESSRSVNLRCCAAESSKKVVFLSENKTILINEMIKNGIGTKPHQVEYYLSQRFRESKNE
jgi:hypothetical protein